MKKPLFEFPSYQYDVRDWQFKKKALLNRIDKSKFIRKEFQNFECDRETAGKLYIKYFQEIVG